MKNIIYNNHDARIKLILAIIPHEMTWFITTINIKSILAINTH